MRLFVVGKLRTGEGQVQTVVAKLNEAGLSVPYDWTKEDPPPKTPYLDHIEHNQPIAERMAFEAERADAIVICVSDSLYGGMVEFGIGLPSHKPIYVLGARLRESLYFTLRQVRTAESTDELIQKIRADFLIDQP